VRGLTEERKLVDLFIYCIRQVIQWTLLQNQVKIHPQENQDRKVSLIIIVDN